MQDFLLGERQHREAAAKHAACSRVWDRTEALASSWSLLASVRASVDGRKRPSTDQSMDRSMDRSMDASMEQEAEAAAAVANLLHSAHEQSKQAQKLTSKRGGDSYLLHKMLDHGAVLIHAAVKETDPQALRLRAELVAGYHLNMVRMHERLASIFELVDYGAARSERLHREIV